MVKQSIHFSYYVGILRSSHSKPSKSFLRYTQFNAKR